MALYPKVKSVDYARSTTWIRELFAATRGSGVFAESQEAPSVNARRYLYYKVPPPLHEFTRAAWYDLAVNGIYFGAQMRRRSDVLRGFLGRDVGDIDIAPDDEGPRQTLQHDRVTEVIGIETTFGIDWPRFVLLEVLQTLGGEGTMVVSCIIGLRTQCNESQCSAEKRAFLRDSVTSNLVRIRGSEPQKTFPGIFKGAIGIASRTRFIGLEALGIL
ncbi:hypothetical protein BC827DRAFT_1156522 [Russula dissimulans]|nr:hypothetical protein BC827DRAFT_1156522 [Russula dissimulans]